MSRNTLSAKRIIAALLIVVFAGTMLASCSVVNNNPLIIKVGNVKVYLEQYASMFNQNLSTYSSQYNYTDSADLVKYQDMIYEQLLEYAIMLNEAQKRNVKDTLTSEEQQSIEDKVEEQYTSFTDGFKNDVSKDDVTMKDLKNLYEFTPEEEQSIPDKVTAKIDEEFKTFVDEVDETITDEAERKEAAENARKLKLEKDGQTFDEYTKQIEEDIRFDLLFEKYSADEAVKLRDEYLKKTAKMSEKEYKQEIRDTETDNVLVDKVQDLIKDEVKEVEDKKVQEWYDEQVKTLTESYKTDTSAYYEKQNAYDSATEDSHEVRPVVVPEGFIRVKHILLKTPAPDSTPYIAPDVTGDPIIEDTNAPEATPEMTAIVTPEVTPEATAIATPEATGAIVEPTGELSPETSTAPVPTVPAATVDPQKIADTEKAIADAKTAAAGDAAMFLTKFDELIAKFGEDTGMTQEPGKSKGYLVAESIKDKYVAAFSEASLALKEVGDVSEAVVSDYGVHYIVMTEKVEAKTWAFEDVKDEIQLNLLDEEKDAHLKNALEDWKKTLNITEYKQRIRAYTGYSQYYTQGTGAN